MLSDLSKDAFAHGVSAATTFVFLPNAFSADGEIRIAGLRMVSAFVTTTGAQSVPVSHGLIFAQQEALASGLARSSLTSLGSRQNNAANLYVCGVSCPHTPVRGSDVGFRRRSALPHTSSVQLISSVWRIGLPLVVVAGSVLLLASAIRSREKSAPMSRLGAAFLLFVWLRIAGEAAFGDQRSVVERQWKGAAAALLAMAGAVHLWKRYRERVHDAPEPAATPQNHPAVAVTATPRSSLAVFVTMPALGEDVTEGTVTRWLKEVGDRVEAGEPLVEVSTDKVDTEITADTSGDLREITVLAGRATPVGTTIAVIEPVDV